jgi:hypothetical protein
MLGSCPLPRRADAVWYHPVVPTVTCSECPTVFDIAPSHLKRLKRPPTCCPECKAASMAGKGHWHWRGGAYIDAEGYRRIWTEDGVQMEHRVVMARKLKRRLRDDELVRHKDGNRLNNKPGNLELYHDPRPRMARARLASVKRVVPRRARRARRAA